MIIREDDRLLRDFASEQRISKEGQEEVFKAEPGNEDSATSKKKIQPKLYEIWIWSRRLWQVRFMG